MTRSVLLFSFWFFFAAFGAQSVVQIIGPFESAAQCENVRAYAKAHGFSAPCLSDQTAP